MLQNITPRKYQKDILETCLKKNCLVVLPTGIGKTLIALMLVIERMKQFPDQKILFLAPTRPLAQQHLNYFKKHLPELYADMQLFTGIIKASKRKKIWQTADIIFSTPQCISNDLKNNLYDLSEVGLLIEDEAHRCIKNYAYRYVAEQYLEKAKHPKILGLTASPGSDKTKIKEICKNLSVEEVELRTRDSDDVKPYLKELKFNIIKVDFPPKFQEIKFLLKEIYDKKVEELKKRRLLFGRVNKITLLELQKKLMRGASFGGKNFNVLIGISVCAQAIKIQHALELLETQTIYSFNNYIQNIFKQAEQGKSKAVQRIVKQKEFNQAYNILTELIAKKQEHPKLIELKKSIEKKIKQNPKAKIIVFSQYRDTIVRICKELNSIPKTLARVFVGQAKRGSGKESTGLSQKEQQQIIRDFAAGEFNILCATSIGEEGLDIPEVHAVIFYEPVPSAIRKIQRAGRTARLIPGELIILVTRGTRDEAYYWAAFHKEKRMHKAIDGIKQELKDNQNKKQKTLF